VSRLPSPSISVQHAAIRVSPSADVILFMGRWIAPAVRGLLFLEGCEQRDELLGGKHEFFSGGWFAGRRVLGFARRGRLRWAQEALVFNPLQVVMNGALRAADTSCDLDNGAVWRRLAYLRDLGNSANTICVHWRRFLEGM
jgi:hypothetical protein